MKQQVLQSTLFATRARLRSIGLVVGIVWFTLAAGCDALNPSFVNVLLPSDVAQDVSSVGQTASGYVPILFTSAAVFDSELLEWMEEQGLDVSDADLRPRIRARVFVQFQDGNSRTLEFLDGSQLSQLTTTTIDETGGTEEVVATLPPDLDRPEINNQVLACDVDLVTIDLDQAAIEVYVPVFWGIFTVETTDLLIQKRLLTLLQPQFWPLAIDVADAFGDITLVRNFDIRDVPGPVSQVTCGSVIGFVLDGTLRVPFEQGPFVEGGGVQGTRFPGFLDDDVLSQNAFPGRFRIRTIVR